MEPITPEEARQDVERENHETVMNRERYEESQFDEDIDLLHDNPAIRFALYNALKDTRGEPGLSIEHVASVINDALSDEEVQSLVDILAKEDVVSARQKVHRQEAKEQVAKEESEHQTFQNAQRQEELKSRLIL